MIAIEPVMKMDIKLNILKQRLEKGLSAQIHVSGDSMYPVLQENDNMSLVKADPYRVGDVLVFYYTQYEFLVHRLLQIRDGLYYCKGDNSFRLEEVESSNIFGKVVSVCRNGNNVFLSDVDDTFINHSLQVSYEFERCGNDVKNTEMYKQYFSKYISDDGLLMQS